MSIMQMLLGAGGAGGGVVGVGDVFSTFLYDGLSDTAQPIENGIDLAGEGGMVIQRRYNTTGYWFVNDNENGENNFLYTNFSSELGVGTSGSSFNSNGFTIGAENNLHATGNDVISYTFRKAPGFFDVVTYTGTGANQDVPHNLGCVPGMVIIKGTSNDDPWFIYHKDLDGSSPEDYNLRMSGNARQLKTTVWNGTPTSTDIKIGTYSDVNGVIEGTGKSYVAYVFADGDEDESLIKCGGYTGSGGDGNAQTVGFEPQWLLIKNYKTAATDWCLVDSERPGSGGGAETPYLNPASSLTASSTGPITFDSNGFTVDSDSYVSNFLDETYVYIAIKKPD